MKTKAIKILRALLYVFFIGMIIFAGYYLLDYANDRRKDNEVVEDLKSLIIDNQEKTKDSISISVDVTKDYSALYEENNDYVGWLKIDGTIVDYPVMQTKEDEEYYLRRNFYKQYSSAGTLFCNAAADLEKPSANVVIHGHNMTAGTMFKTIVKYESEEFYKEHKYITFDTIYEYGTYEVIAAYRTDVNPGCYEYYNFVDGTEEEYNEFVDFAKKRTPYKTDSTAEYGDRLITLSTCTYHTTNGRYVVVAKQIESQPIIEE